MRSTWGPVITFWIVAGLAVFSFGTCRKFLSELDAAFAARDAKWIKFRDACLADGKKRYECEALWNAQSFARSRPLP